MLYKTKESFFFDTKQNKIADWIDSTLARIRPSVFLTLVGRYNPCGVPTNQHLLTQITENKKVIVFLTENFYNIPSSR